MITILLYDGTFEGFLSAVFSAYDLKIKNVSIRKKAVASENFFDDFQEVITNESHAQRVWECIKKNCTSEGVTRLYKSFLSELPSIEDTMFQYIKLALSEKNKIDGNYSHPAVMKLSKVAKMVSREKHRMDAFVRFKLTKDDIYFAVVEPDFDVLPLNAKHFKNRYADQKWIIYDLKRGYGLFYDLQKIETIQIEISKGLFSKHGQEIFFTPEELQFEELWQNYFKSTNIETRKNTRLHIKHVPKRYWKYLSEKQLISKN